MKTVLITGGVGFIGSHLTKYLFDNYDYNIIVLDALTYAGNMNNIPDYIKKDSRFTFWYGNIRRHRRYRRRTRCLRYTLYPRRNYPKIA